MSNRLLTWAVIVLAATSVLFWGLWLQERELHRVYSDARAVTEAVRRLGSGFENVEIMVSSHPRVNIRGEVQRDDDLNRLKEALGLLNPDANSPAFVKVEVRPKD